MSKGFCILAQNSEVNYVKQAYACAVSIVKNMPDAKITLITNDNVEEKYKAPFDQIVPIPWNDQAKESDWKTYTGSSDRLNKDIEELGKDKFKFEIIRSCGNKSELAYMETLYQFQAEALISEEYYNGILNIRIGKVKFTKSPPKLLLS